MFKRTILLATALVLMVIVSGCGQKNLTERQMEKALEDSLGGNAKVNLNNNEVNIETDQGSMNYGENVKLPNDFPKDIYLIDGQIMSVTENFMGAKYQVMIKSDASVSDAKDLYESKLKEEGWAITSSFNMGTAAMLSANKGDQQLSVTLGTEEEKDGMAVVLTLTDSTSQMPMTR